MQFCRCHEIRQIRVEADISADALWCDRCLTNLAAEDFIQSVELKRELQLWINDYGTWIDWKNDGIMPNGVMLERQHNERGGALAAKVKRALEGKYSVVFSPSVFALTYSEW